MDARIRGSLSVRFVGVLFAALMLAPLLARDAGAQVNTPQALSATILGRGVTLRWQPPSSVTQPLTGYVIEAGASPGTTGVSQPLGNVLSYFVIAPNGRYYVRVRALFGVTPGPASNEIEVVVPPLPTAPTNLAATVARFTVNLTWNFGFGSASVTEWQVHAGSAPGLSDLAIETLPSSTRLITATVGERHLLRSSRRAQRIGRQPAVAGDRGHHRSQHLRSPQHAHRVSGDCGAGRRDPELGRLDGSSAHRLPAHGRAGSRRGRLSAIRAPAHHGLRLVRAGGVLLREARYL